MKSAYELAMERLEKESGPTKSLTDEQKKAIAEIERKYDAMIAEKKLAIESKLAQASSFEEKETLRTELAEALASYQEKRDREKEAIWNKE